MLLSFAFAFVLLLARASFHVGRGGFVSYPVRRFKKNESHEHFIPVPESPSLSPQLTNRLSISFKELAAAAMPSI